MENKLLKKERKEMELTLEEKELDMKQRVTSGVKSILKLYLSKSIVTHGKTTRSKVESID